MHRPASTHARRAATASAAILLSAFLGGCAVVSVVGTAASITATGAGLVVDAAAGTVRLTGKVVGATADALLPNETE
jgi:hypothetical protein